jgi:acetyl esterase/lipase
MARLKRQEGPGAGSESEGGWAEESSAVHAVVNLYGPTDLAAVCDQAQLGIVFRAADCGSPALTLAGPVAYVHAGAPPFPIIQGTEDLLVPVAQAQILADQLTDAGVTVALLLVEHAGHGLRALDGDPDPSTAEIIRRMADFFDRDRSGRTSSYRMKAVLRAGRDPSVARLATLHANR